MEMQVRLVQRYGTELDIVNAARVSYAKESAEFGEQDQKLLAFLLKHKHMSPFRHVFLQFEIYAPLMVARQLWKHVVGVSNVEAGTNWNESSRRYVTETAEFWTPKRWRLAAENKKQGSAGFASEWLNAKYDYRLNRICNEGLAAYEEALRDGIAPELARLLLPAYAMLVRWRWTASADALLNLLELRLHANAQLEAAEIAQQLEAHMREQWPILMEIRDTI